MGIAQEVGCRELRGRVDGKKVMVLPRRESLGGGDAAQLGRKLCFSPLAKRLGSLRSRETSFDKRRKKNARLWYNLLVQAPITKRAENMMIP